MTDDDVEKIIKRNMNLQMNLAGIRSDFEEATQRTWARLTDDEINDIVHNHDELNGLWELIDMVEAKIKEKNT